MKCWSWCFVHVPEIVQGKCACIDNGLLCTDACAKQKCENFICFETEHNEVAADFLSSDEEENY